MLSLFPTLLSYPLLAYLIVRLVVSWGIIRTGIIRWKKPLRQLAIAEFIAGILVFIGLYTQAAVIGVVALIVIDKILDARHMTLAAEDKTIGTMIVVLAISLLFTGPGAYAFDLPL